ncbi:MAG: hypothetical protein COX62_03585 [Deltaproteobacteria bacterium CG_4_10_14_0_2_um_filter_43_8]|nr:MAG: hypothetical protein COX62_03585 [Deltaproteobacteria bacterium CG_4_10_14_0_2_um_filter_43_8]
MVTPQPIIYVGTKGNIIMSEQIKNKRIETIQPNKIGKAIGKAQAGSNFDSFLGAVDAMAPMNAELMYQATGSNTAAAVLHGAFTGMGGAAGSYGYGGASYGGFGGGAGGFGALSEYPGMMGVGGSSTLGTGLPAYGKASGPTGLADTPGGATGNLPTGDLINTMNTNNLKLLELQAVMQSNMQSWNTKSNILSADHRARMAMIEKFSARG